MADEHDPYPIRLDEQQQQRYVPPPAPNREHPGPHLHQNQGPDGRSSYHAAPHHQQHQQQYLSLQRTDEPSPSLLASLLHLVEDGCSQPMISPSSFSAASASTASSA